MAHSSGYHGMVVVVEVVVVVLYGARKVSDYDEVSNGVLLWLFCSFPRYMNKESTASTTFTSKESLPDY